MGAVRQVSHAEVLEEKRSHLGETAVGFESGSTNLDFGMFATAHVQKMSPSPGIACDDDGGFGFIGQERPRRLADFFTEICFAVGAEDFTTLFLFCE